MINNFQKIKQIHSIYLLKIQFNQFYFFFYNFKHVKNKNKRFVLFWSMMFGLNGTLRKEIKNRIGGWKIARFFKFWTVVSSRSLTLLSLCCCLYHHSPPTLTFGPHSLFNVSSPLSLKRSRFLPFSLFLSEIHSFSVSSLLGGAWFRDFYPIILRFSSVYRSDMEVHFS